MKNIILAGLLLLISCAGAPVSQPEFLADDRAAHGNVKSNFCRMMDTEIAKIREQIQANADGAQVNVESVSCEVFANSLGKSTFLVHVSAGGTTVYDMEVARIMAYQGGSWLMINQGPIYLIDYMNGRIVWFIENQVQSAEPGSQI